MAAERLILYRGLMKKDLFVQMTEMIKAWEQGTLEKSGECAARVAGCVGELIEFAERCGFEGNLWQCYLADLLVNDENAYSLGCELRKEPTGSIEQAALCDIRYLHALYFADLERMSGELDLPELMLAAKYQRDQKSGRMYNHRISEQIQNLAREVSEGGAQGPEHMKLLIAGFYRKFGVGKFGLHKSFRVVRGADGVSIEPIRNIAHVKFDDLVGYEGAKKKLCDNTDAFVERRPANNCLLFGDAGTGKSSCIKAMANEYYEKGLRVIEIYKHQFQDLNEVISQVKNRGYRFVIYMDDLSFEDFETEYKYLKAVIEGGLERRPENVLIYATSNRRHLIRENYADKEDQDMHTGDTVQEKMSLAYRFGVTIYFGRPDKKEFQTIVRVLAERYAVTMPEEELLLEANKWELSHGGLSGRTASQFIDYLRGKKE